MGNENAHQPSDLKQMQSLPLEAKIVMSEARIRTWYESWTRFEIYNTKTGKSRFVTMDTRDRDADPKLRNNEIVKYVFDGQVYVSFSGGKDSTVLADLCARVCKEYGYTLYLLFVNTGLEYPEIQKFVRKYAEWLRNTYEIEVQLDVVRPEMRFDEVLSKHGFPVASKRVSGYVETAKRHPDSQRAKWIRGEEWTKFVAGGKWAFLIDAPFDVSAKCCDIMKKSPIKKYCKETGRKAIVGTLACESPSREQAWRVNGCNAFDAVIPTSQPLSFWTEQDILHYIKRNGLPYSSVYGDIRIMPHGEGCSVDQIDLIDYLGCYTSDDTLITTGCKRTGCIFCMFGCHLEKGQNRFQMLKETHPRQYDYCINGGEMVDGKWQPSKEGLGLGKVLDYIGVKYD